MKRSILLVLSVILLVLLAACGGGEAGPKKDEDGNIIITVGASSTPHAEILEEAKPILKEKGIALEIEEYVEFVLPNDDVDNGTLDANYFQHVQYLEKTIEDTGYDFANIGNIHTEPMGAYSKGITSIDAIPDGTEIVLSNSVSDHGRVLGLFQKEGLITLDESVDLASAEIKDIVDNPKNLTFKPDYTPEFLPEIYESEPDALVVINTNFAIQGGLNPEEDALFIEGKDSPYVNIVVAKTENKDDPSLKTLVEVLTSDEIQDFIIEQFDGAVIPYK